MFLGADANIPGYVFFTQYHRGKHGPKTNVRDSASSADRIVHCVVTFIRRVVRCGSGNIRSPTVLGILCL